MLRAVAFPLEEMPEELGFAAVATRADAEKARANKKPRSEATLGPRMGAVAGPRGGAVRTAKQAPPIDALAVEALKARRDKVAAKERLIKLPDHGRHVAPQGLYCLQKGFETRPPVTAQVVRTHGESEKGVLALKGVSRGVHLQGGQLLEQPGRSVRGMMAGGWSRLLVTVAL